MKVKMLKRHQGHKTGELVEVNEERARYWIMCGVAKKSRALKAENKNAAPKTEDK